MSLQLDNCRNLEQTNCCYGNGTLIGSVNDVAIRGYTSGTVTVVTQESDDLLTFYTTCIKITRTDGVILAMTELDQDLTVDAQLYISSVSYVPTTLSTSANLSVNNAETGGFIAELGLDRDDIIAGLYDGAEILFFVYDYSAGSKVRDLGIGTLGEITLSDNKYSAEYRSITQKMQQTIGRVYGAECDAKLGDARCGVTLSSYTVTGTLTAVTSNSVFTDTARVEADDLYNYGLITFTSGANTGLSREVKAFGSGQFTVHLPFPHTIGSSDAYSVYQGCDKRQATCIAKFNNIDNFRGFPFIVGADALMKFGGQ